MLKSNNMKKCIWCSRTEDQTTFKNLAHTIPQNLGGKNTCSNVCDDCNAFFGSYNNKILPVESAIRETFVISRARYLDTQNEIGKNKAMPKFKSQYFDFDHKTKKLKIKTKYQFDKYFQKNLSRQFRKGLYKIYLEETERQNQDGHHSKYDFIREFCRYDLGELPVFYFERRHGIIVLMPSWAKSPELFMEDDSQFKYLVREPNFFEFELFGHVFGIATSRNWELVIDNYIRKSTEAKKEFFKSCKLVKHFNDVDFALSILDS